MGERTFADGKAHFKEFYGKLNVISEIITKKKNTNLIPANIGQTFNKIFGDSKTAKLKPGIKETPTLQAILDKLHESDSLIGTFEYQKPDKPDKPDTTNSIAKKLRVGSNEANKSFSVIINNDAQVEIDIKPDWFDESLVSIFRIEEEEEEGGGTSNIKELHSKTHDYTSNIKSLFTFKQTTGTGGVTADYYVWESKYYMLALFNQPFLLLTFDMYYYNVKKKPLFKNNFDIKNETAVSGRQQQSRPQGRTGQSQNLDGNRGEKGSFAQQWEGEEELLNEAEGEDEAEGEEEGEVQDEGERPLTVESLLYIETFSGKLPTFLMLLIYYAGYSFNIDVEDITSKFRNKFNQSTNRTSFDIKLQSTNRTSFDIKLYAPIPDKIETIYNNVLKSQIQPNSVDLTFEKLEVYHVGSEVISLWDYVNGKLTILINNMLNSKDKDDKNRYKTLFKKPYTSNSLFLFECIDALKKYKEYILIPANITTIAFPMSTLKTLEILILKLSYILSVLEPTFIPIETMSFDVIMNGKTLKYVINSELQATNISIDDYISNDKLMSAILSTRAAVMTPTNSAKANTFLTDSNALDIQKSVIKKMVDDYRRNYLEKNIAYERIQTDSDNSKEKLLTLSRLTSAALNTRDLTNNIQYMESLVKDFELELHLANANFDKNMAHYKMTTAISLFEAVDVDSELQNIAVITKLQSDLNNNHPEYDADNSYIQQADGNLQENRRLLLAARKQTPQQIAEQQRQARTRQRILNRASSTRKDRVSTSSLESSGRMSLGDSNLLSIHVTVTDKMKNPKYTFGLSFGAIRSVSHKNFELGKIVRMDKFRDATYSERAQDAKSKNRFQNIQGIVQGIGSKPKQTVKEEWPFGDSLDDKNKIFILKKIIDSGNAIIWSTDAAVTATEKLGLNNLLVFDRTDIKLQTFFDRNTNLSKGQIEMAYKLQNLIDKLTNLTNEQHTFFFETKDNPKKSQESDLAFAGAGGGKNTTKKVNRKQRQGQTHSKTKKIFESEVNK